MTIKSQEFLRLWHLFSLFENLTGWQKIKHKTVRRGVSSYYKKIKEASLRWHVLDQLISPIVEETNNKEISYLLYRRLLTPACLMSVLFQPSIGLVLMRRSIDKHSIHCRVAKFLRLMH